MSSEAGDADPTVWSIPSTPVTLSLMVAGFAVPVIVLVLLGWILRRRYER